jgi:hypothetical protein
MRHAAACRADSIRRRARNGAGKSLCLRAPGHLRKGIDLGFWWLWSGAGRAMNRFVHRIIMSVLLVAALVLMWNVLGTR